MVIESLGFAGVLFDRRAIWIRLRASILRGLLLILLLQFPQFAPAGVLLGFGGIGVFFTLEPETEPVHISLLRYYSVPWLLEDMLIRIGDNDHLHRLPKLLQSCQPFPHEDGTEGSMRPDPHRHLYPIHFEARSHLQPGRQCR